MPRWLWRLVTVASIIFAAGVSGSWLGQQMTNPLPLWWGWLGAGILGLTTFGGVSLAVKGQKIGWAIVVVSGLASITFDYHYFGSDHTFFVSAVLGGFSTVLAVLSGTVEVTTESINQSAVDLEREREDARRLALEERERLARQQDQERRLVHEIQLAKIQAAKEAKLAEIESKRETKLSEIIAPSVSGAKQDVTEDQRTNKSRIFEALDTDSDISNAALASQFTVSIDAARAYRSQWRKARMISGNGNSNGNGHHQEGEDV